MKTKLTPILVLIIFCFNTLTLFSQENILTGVLKDDSEQPLPGVNITIKGTTIGTTTDFDGNYSIPCNIGDILVFNYVGFSKKEVTVTPEMFRMDTDSKIVEKISVVTIKSDAYENAIKNNQTKDSIIKNIENSDYIYNKKSAYLQHERIKDINLDTSKVKLTYFKPDIFFEVGYTNINGIQFVKNSNLPNIQNSYSQGASSTFLGAETGNIFSYGPKISTLEFDGSNYLYDNNGQLVSLGSGNGDTAKAYNNNLFNTSINTSHHVFFNISTETSLLGFNFTHKTLDNLYNFERNISNDFIIHFNNKPDNNKLSWDAFIKLNNNTDNQPNINGFQNNLLLNNWITPATFNNNEGYLLSNDLQRSFSPNSYNNPYWLLNNNKNSLINKNFVTSLKNKFDLNEIITFNSKLNYTNFKNTQNFGVVKNTIGFNDGYFSERFVNKNNLNAVLDFKYDKKEDFKLKVLSTINYNYEDLKYTLNQFSGFNTFSFNNPTNTSINNNTLNRNTVRLFNQVNYETEDNAINISFTNNSYISSIQNDKWFLPTLGFKIDFVDVFRIYDFNELSLSMHTSFDVNDTTLLYNNTSHNSLNINPNESLQYLAVNDLFINNTIKLEEKESYDISLASSFRLFDENFRLDLNYTNTTINNAIFPIIENNVFNLKNIANVLNRSFDAELNFYAYGSYHFRYNPKIMFSTYRTKVLDILNDSDRIPIAGFLSTSKNLIIGESAGVIVGSAYERDENNNIIIDDNGFPLVSNETKIIGDPTPKFNLGFSNHFRWKNVELDFVLDIQKGGDIWNGTQNVLNYFGTSQQSVNDRNITNYIFSGVDINGDKNTIPVDFYNTENDISENRFVRYGFEGVAEDAIEDGSFINLKSLNLSYHPIDNVKNKFIRDLKISIYGNNLYTWTKFKGASPYSSLYANASGNGLNFFNAPIISEVGFKINVKI